MSSANQDRGRNNIFSGLPPEAPRRPTLAASTPISMDGTAIPHSLSSAAPRPDRCFVAPAIREIHKNAWLKRFYTSYDKKGVPFVKRSEKWWVVFCVHDDVSAFLEFYTEPKMAQVHQPATRISLNKCLHVSPSIVGQDNEYQFAVNLASQGDARLIINLAASDWDQMLEWVETLQAKLREMSIICPKDNLYSKLPETRSCNVNSSALTCTSSVLSTRDPNSPLPPTPNGTVSPELTSVQTVNVMPPSTDYTESSGTTVHQTNIALPDDHSSDPILSASVYVPSSGNGIRCQRGGSSSCSGSGSADSILETDSATSGTGSSSSGSLPGQNNNATVDAVKITNPIVRPSEVEVIIGTNNNSTVVQIGFENSTREDRILSNAVIPARNSIPSSSSQRSTPRQRIRSTPRNKTDPGVTFDSLQAYLPVPHVDSGSYVRQLSAPLELGQSSEFISSDLSANEPAPQATYEHIFDPWASDGPSVSLSATSDSNSEGSFPPSIPLRSANGKRIAGTAELSPQGQSTATDSNARTRDTPSVRTTNTRAGFPPQIEVANPADLAVSPAHVFLQENSNGVFGVRRRGYRVPKEREEPTEHSNSNPKIGATSSHVPLKESQVMQLNMEINHTEGVRIVLRKKGCIDTIAFVDYLGAVWIAGWKQQKNPVLYYAFHVGDQVLKIGDQTVESSEDAKRAIKMTTSHQVEFIIRRLPYGRVFVLKRKLEGEPLGLVAVGNCAEISEVVPNGLAATEGLPPKATGVDGQSLCNWFLTEINNRPLSLIAKESEVRNRLNAVGKDISILVQPSDLVKHLKKQLKSIKAFEEYLVV